MKLVDIFESESESERVQRLLALSETRLALSVAGLTYLITDIPNTISDQQFDELIRLSDLWEVFGEPDEYFHRIHSQQLLNIRKKISDRGVFTQSWKEFVEFILGFLNNDYDELR